MSELRRALAEEPLDVATDERRVRDVAVESLADLGRWACVAREALR